MAGPSWLVNKITIATKIKCAGTTQKVTLESNPTIACPNCQYVIDNSHVSQEWPGLPKGVKFDPSDQEIIWHLLAKVGEGNSKPHPFIDAFIITIKVNDGICYTHPQHLPGVSQDGIVSHFFHRAVNAYNSGNRKRRKVCGQDFGDLRWHKTGRTKPIILNGVQKGCKKIMVLYMTPENGGKAEKTNWVMHQYHLGTEEDEKDGEYVVSKVFYQQQQGKLGENDDQDVPETAETTIANVDLVTANSVTPEPPLVTPNFVDQEQETQHIPLIQPNFPRLEESLLDSQDDYEKLPEIDPSARETQINEDIDNIDLPLNLLDSQQLGETFSSFEDFFQSQSPKRHRENGEQKNQPSLSTYDHLGAEQLNKNMEGCENLDIDTGNVEIDSQPSDVRLSQLVFNSQDSYIAWGGNCIF